MRAKFMLRRVLLPLFMSIIGFGLAACNLADQVRAAEFERRLDAAESRWQEQNISDYRIAVTTASVWRAQTVTLTVRGGEVADHMADCVVAPLEFDRTCEIVPYDPERLTLDGLFNTARDYIMRGENGSVPYAIAGLRFEFDETYSYLERISSSPPGVMDADSVISVSEFEPLAPE